MNVEGGHRDSDSDKSANASHVIPIDSTSQSMVYLSSLPIFDM